MVRQALSHRLVYPPSRSIGDEVMALLYAADRLDHLQAIVLPRLERGITVVCDRYRLSSYAYQGLTTGLDWVKALNSKAMPPDLTIFIDVPPETSQARISHRGDYVELYETDERLRPVYSNYLSLIEEMRATGERVSVVNGTGTKEEVAAAVLAAAESVLHE